MSKPFQVVRDFERAIAEYTGAPYVVCMNSCTSALLLAVAWYLRGGGVCRVCGLTGEALQRAGGHLCDRSPCDWQNIRPRSIEIPKRTYVSVPMSIIHAGGRPTFRDEVWQGAYQLNPLPVWDSARHFSSGLYRGMVNGIHGLGFRRERNLSGHMVCVSFHASKTLGIEQGGAILHDNAEADAWLRRARFDGRTEGVAPKDDKITQVGWHCYLNPSTAAQGLLKLNSLPRHNAPLQNDDYPDLSQMEIFR